MRYLSKPFFFQSANESEAFLNGMRSIVDLTGSGYNNTVSEKTEAESLHEDFLTVVEDFWAVVAQVQEEIRQPKPQK